MILSENAIKGTYVRKEGVQMDVRLQRDYPRGVFTPDSVSWSLWVEAVARICPEGLVMTEVRVMGNMAQVTFMDQGSFADGGE